MPFFFNLVAQSIELTLWIRVNMHSRFQEDVDMRQPGDAGYVSVVYCRVETHR